MSNLGARWTKIGTALFVVVGFASVSFAEQVWSASGGSVAFYPEWEAAEELGVLIREGQGANALMSSAAIFLSLENQAMMTVDTAKGKVSSTPRGQFPSSTALLLESPSGRTMIRKPTIRSIQDGASIRYVIVDAQGDTNAILMELHGAKVGFDPNDQVVRIESAEVTLAPATANALGDWKLAGANVGSLRGQVYVDWISGEAPVEANPLADSEGANEGGVAGGNQGTVCGIEDTQPPLCCPDVIVGDLVDTSNYNSLGGIEAFAIGTTSCNIGESNLLWIAGNNQHPVIGQNLFRLKNDRMEQVGQSWLKHGFTALTENICGCGCNGDGGAVLGVGCSDPYCCGLNGSQGNLGPKWQVNAFSGFYVMPHEADNLTGNSIYKRLQVRISDLDPALDGGGIYFAEGQYVTADDAAAANQNNNASYRRLNITGSGTVWNCSFSGSFLTQREQPGIRAWKDTDATVTETDVIIPNEGLVIVSSKATDLLNGFFSYEYGVQNVTSDRSVGSFSVPISAGAMVQNIGFHDVDYHSDTTPDPPGHYDLTDWPATVTSNAVTWSTTAFASNPDANALRWGTLYNFRFEANVAPGQTLVTLGLFKPGSPTSVTALSEGPTSCIPEECNDGNLCTNDNCGIEGCSYVNNTNVCDDGIACTFDDLCTLGVCLGRDQIVKYADLEPRPVGNGMSDLDDLICMLLAFANLADCPDADIYPCAPNGDGVIDLDDLTAMLEAIAGNLLCADPCPP
ncbi:MAG: hypothetical protein AABZ47_03555 [Planctomycetota bacterium]